MGAWALHGAHKSPCIQQVLASLLVGFVSGGA